MDLQQYERFKFDLADVLRATDARLPPRSPIRYNEVRDLFARLAEDRFNLVVIGRFSRGKSSLMNAVLGMERLPTGVVPLTSVITTVAYGSDEKVVLYYQNSSLFTDIAISQLEENITERGNPGNRKRIRTAEVQLPSDILRRGFHFIDTPGLGSSILENTRTTEAFLPEADAVILVTSYDSPLSEEELRTLETIRRSGRRCFVVLNKQDSIPPCEASEVRAHVEHQLDNFLGESRLALFSVSALQALAARQTHDAIALQGSGLPSLEEALITFLVNEKHQEFLLGMMARIGDLGRRANTSPDVSHRLDRLKSRLKEVTTVPAASGCLERDLSTADLPGCEICRRVSDEVFNFLAQFQRLLRDDAEVQARHAESGGLCGRHTVQFETLAATKEICTGFAPVLERQAARLRQAARSGGKPSKLCDEIVESLPTNASCLACDAARKALSDEIQHVANSIPKNGKFRLRSVLCLPHLGELITRLPAETSAMIMEDQATILEGFAGDMRRFALKQEGAKRYLSSREENMAAKRGLRALLGDPNATADVLQPHAGAIVELVFGRSIQ